MKEKLINIGYYIIAAVISFGTASVFLERKKGMVVSFASGNHIPEFIGVYIGFVGSMIGLAFLTKAIFKKIEFTTTKPVSYIAIIFTVFFSAIIYWGPNFLFRI